MIGIYFKLFEVESNSKERQRVTVEPVLKKSSSIVNFEESSLFIELDSTWKILESTYVHIEQI